MIETGFLFYNMIVVLIVFFAIGLTYTIGERYRFVLYLPELHMQNL